MSLMKLALVAPLALSLAGCAGTAVSVVEPVPPVGSYYNGDFEYATRKGAIRTEVAGRPFQVSDEALASRVRQLMYRQNRGAPARFVAKNGDNTDPAYKVAVAFNLQPNYGGHDLCKASADSLPTTPPGAPARLTIAFCFADDMKTEVNGRVSGATGLNDPLFVKLVQQTTLGLIPAYDGQDHGGDPGRN